MEFLDFFKECNNSESTTNKNAKTMDVNNPQISTKRPTFTSEHINSLLPNEVFVFGSNLAGHHGGGAARTALNKFGAIYGQGVGLQGQSYAIPTMQGGTETIAPYVDEFITFAKEHPEKFFYVTRIGCGIAGFRDEEIAPLFSEALKLDNICLPESFVQILTIRQIPESYKIKEYGQVRTLADIVKTLNEQHHYTTLEALLNDFHEVLEQYKRRGTIPMETFYLIQSIFLENTNYIFDNGQLNIVHLEELLSDRNYVYDKMESVFQKRSRGKILGIIQYLNEHKKYTLPEQLFHDLAILFNPPGCHNYLNDSFHYPLFFFERGLNNLWEKITKDGQLDNELLEKFMFDEHNEKVKSLGLQNIIKTDYEADGPCHPEVYFPRETGTAPVYVEKMNQKFIKSCGEGKGPNGIPNFYEQHLLEIIKRGTHC
jgi:hypothetical protein